MASMAPTRQLEPLEEDRKFSLHYNQKIILERLIRKGGEREPIHEDLQFDKFSQDNEYEDLGDPAATAEPPRVDFRVDRRGFTIAEKSSGNVRL